MNFAHAAVTFLWSLTAVQLLTVVGIILVKSKRTLIAVLCDIGSLIIIGYFTASQFTYMQTNFPVQLAIVSVVVLILVIALIRDVRNYVKEIKHNQTTIE
ncbi:hypothetical protein LG275_11090 [Chryseomicrobium palamuruense]